MCVRGGEGVCVGSKKTFFCVCVGGGVVCVSRDIDVGILSQSGLYRMGNIHSG